MKLKWLKRVLALVILAFLFYLVNPSELIGALQNLSFWYVMIIFVHGLAMVWVSAMKWNEVLRYVNSKSISTFYLAKLYFVGYFFNFFLPSSLGGDVARGYALGKTLENKADGLVSTFLERFTGLVAMCILGAFALFLNYSNAKLHFAGEKSLIISFFIIFCIATMMLCFFVFSKKVREYVALSLRFESLAGKNKIFGKLYLLYKSLNNFNPGLKDLGAIFIYSFVFHVMVIVNVVFCAEALGWSNYDLSMLFVVVPVVLLVALVPLTPNGLGLVEGAFIFALTSVGATSPQAFGVSLILRAKILVFAAIGAIFFVYLGRDERKK